MMDDRGAIWTARIGSLFAEIAPIGAAWGGAVHGDVGFFTDRMACVKAHDWERTLDRFYDGQLQCMALASGEWHAAETIPFIDSSSGSHTWWGIGEGKVFRTRADAEHRQWEPVDIGTNVSVVNVEPFSSAGGEELLILSWNDVTQEYIVQSISSAGYVVASTPIGAVRVVTLSAQGGRTAVGSVEGVFVLEARSWRKVMPECEQ